MRKKCTWKANLKCFFILRICQNASPKGWLSIVSEGARRRTLKGSFASRQANEYNNLQCVVVVVVVTLHKRKFFAAYHQWQGHHLHQFTVIVSIYWKACWQLPLSEPVESDTFCCVTVCLLLFMCKCVC